MTHRIEMVPLSSLVEMLDPENEKAHDLPDIKESIRRHGFTTPAEVDERTGKIGAGHGRIEALWEMHRNGEPTPKRLELDDRGDEWLVPLLRDALDTADDLDAAAYRVGANRLTEKGGWVHDKLTASLSALRDAKRLEGTGYTPPDIDSLLASMPRQAPTEAPDQSAKLITRRSVLADVPDDASQRALIAELTDRGIKCRALNS